MSRSRRPGFTAIAAALGVSVPLGCATPPGIYRPTEPAPESRTAPSLDDSLPQLERGRAFWPVDSLNKYLLSLPAKIVLLNWRIMDHELPPKSERLLVHYLDLNRLESVKIRYNQYAPIQEFKRLVRNSEVAPGYRYTVGLIAWLRYALLPDRLFGGSLIAAGDHFNPYTNTINVYSSDPSVLIHETGHAKDFAQAEFKGTYAVARLIPGVDVLQEAAATQDAIRYFYCVQDAEEELHAYRTLFPAYATYFGNYIPGGPALGFGAVVIGHAAGGIKAWNRSSALWSDTPPEFELPPWCTPVAPEVPSP